MISTSRHRSAPGILKLAREIIKLLVCPVLMLLLGPFAEIRSLRNRLIHELLEPLLILLNNLIHELLMLLNTLIHELLEPFVLLLLLLLDIISKPLLWPETAPNDALAGTKISSIFTHQFSPVLLR